MGKDESDILNMKDTLLIIVFLLTAFSIRSQVVSDVTAELAGDKVTVHYSLQSVAPANCFLSYSADGGRTFHPCVNVSGDLWAQTSGAKTIIWNHTADNMQQGTLFFKVEALKVEQAQPAVAAAPVPTTTTPIATTPTITTPGDGVMIGNVRWATRNVGSSGTFVANPEDYGSHYTWEEAQNACPKGWRLPTQEELQKLADAGSTWITQNGVSGRRFGSDTNTIFLPAAGYRRSSNASLRSVGSNGSYWSSTVHSTYSYYLYFNSSSVTPAHYYYRSFGFSVRCVCDQE